MSSTTEIAALRIEVHLVQAKCDALRTAYKALVALLVEKGAITEEEYTRATKVVEEIEHQRPRPQ